MPMPHSYPFPFHVLPTFFTYCSTDECCDLLLDALVFTDFWVATHGFRQFLSREMHRALIPASSSSNFTRVTHALAVLISLPRNCHVSGSGLLHSHDPLHHFDNGLFQVLHPFSVCRTYGADFQQFTIYHLRSVRTEAVF